MIDFTSRNPMVNSQIRKASITIEIFRVRVLISFLAIGLVLMAVNFLLVNDGAAFFKHDYTKFAVLGWLASFLFFEIFCFFGFKSYIKRNIDLPDYIKFINITIEALLPGILLFLLVTLEESPIFLDSPLIFVYFILLSLAALNLQIIHTIILGAISTLSYFFVTLWAIHYHDSENLILHFPPALYIARSLFMLLAFLGATLVAREFKKWLNFSMSWETKHSEIERLFGQQVSGPIAQTLVDNDTLIKSGEVSVMFLDIRGYSSYAEQKSPKQIIQFQNSFFNPIITIINEKKGIVNQILGDGLMATFGAPVSDQAHAQQAYDAALEIFKEVDLQIKAKNIPPTKLGIGIHSGKVVMGNIGNELRKQFSISGHTVNIAARIEQANVEFKSELLLSETTYKKIKKSDQITSIGNIKMKNISKEIKIYRAR